MCKSLTCYIKQYLASRSDQMVLGWIQHLRSLLDSTEACNHSRSNQGRNESLLGLWRNWKSVQSRQTQTECCHMTSRVILFWILQWSDVSLTNTYVWCLFTWRLWGCWSVFDLDVCASVSQECLLGSCNKVKEGTRHFLARECRTLIIGLKKPRMCEMVKTNL